MERIRHIPQDYQHSLFCDHYLKRHNNLRKRVEELKYYSHQGNRCETCLVEASEDDVGLWICVDCGDHFCDNDDVGDHIEHHSRISGHPLAIRTDRLDQFCCFLCKRLKPITVDMTKGIPNNWNTCFFNAILQNLLAMSELPQFVRKLKPKGDVTKSLQRLIVEQHYQDFELDPKQLLQSVSTTWKQTDIGEQQDSHEFFTFLIGELEKEDMNLGYQTFRGSLSSTVTCGQCGKNSLKYDLFLDLSLEVLSMICSAKTDDGTASKPDMLPPLRDKDDNKGIAILGGKSTKNASQGPRKCAKLSSSGPVSNAPTVHSDDWPEDCHLVKECLQKSACNGESSKAGPVPRPISKKPKSAGNGGSSAAHKDETCEVDDSGGPSTVEGCLKLFTSVETLPKSKCEHCDTHSEKFKRLLICRAPPILTIHLKRFCVTETRVQKKVQGHIGFQEILDLTPFTDPKHVKDQVLKYQLRGIVEHNGSTTTSGHYVAFVRREQFRWFKASDADVQKVTLPEVLQREAYILFYERILW